MKVAAYRCDQCKAWVEEDEVTVATFTFEGRVAATYRLELCVRCVEKHEPEDAEAVAQRPARKHGHHFTLEQRTAIMQEGNRLIDGGATIADILKKFGITRATWGRWRLEASRSASLSASAANGDGREKLGSGL